MEKWSNQCKKTWRLGFRFPRQNLSGLSAPKAYLNKIKLCGADLSNSNIQDANLWKAKLQNANLFKANLQDTNLWVADLQNADVWEANLQDANLQNADLQNADLSGANLQDGDLREAKLSGAIYTDSESKFIWCSNNDCSTIVPDDFDPKQAGRILIRTQEDYDKWKKYRQK